MFHIFYPIVYGKIKSDLVRYSRRKKASHMTATMTHSRGVASDRSDRSYYESYWSSTTISCKAIRNSCMTKMKFTCNRYTQMSLYAKRTMKMDSLWGRDTETHAFCEKYASWNTISFSRTSTNFSFREYYYSCEWMKIWDSRLIINL